VADSGRELENPLQSAEADPRTHNSYWLGFKSFRLFPPRRDNLIVAELETSEAWHELYRQVCQVSSTCGPVDLAHLVQSSSHGGKWTPHITLADVVWKSSPSSDQQWRRNQPLAGRPHRHTLPSDDSPTQRNRFRAQQKQVLTTELLEITRTFCENVNGHQHSNAPKGISMGGPIPPQVDLDWNFVARPTL
jgi:hypothetical protein